METAAKDAVELRNSHSDHLCISSMPEENHSLDRRNKAHQHVIDVMVRDTTPMNADLKRSYVISAKNGTQ